MHFDEGHTAATFQQRSASSKTFPTISVVTLSELMARA